MNVYSKKKEDLGKNNKPINKHVCILIYVSARR